MAQCNRLRWGHWAWMEVGCGPRGWYLEEGVAVQWSGAIGRARLKALGRWLAFGVALVFLGRTLGRHWGEVAALKMAPWGWGALVGSLGLTLVAHVWAGWTWSWTLQALQQPIAGEWSSRVYLQTNLLKYLPGNVWHFWGRVRALQGEGIALRVAVVGVALEPLLMATAALVVALATPTRYWLGQVLLLGLALEMLRPRWLNPIAHRWRRPPPPPLPPPPGSPPPPATAAVVGLRGYPVKLLASQVVYVLLRGLSFTLVLAALTPLAWVHWPPTVSAFSLAWLAGLVVPGAPGGLGVSEAIALGLLQGRFPVAPVLGAVVLYRLVNTLAEALGAALATLALRLGLWLR